MTRHPDLPYVHVRLGGQSADHPPHADHRPCYPVVIATPMTPGAGCSLLVDRGQTVPLADTERAGDRMLEALPDLFARLARIADLQSPGE
jgi:hypothetical protein